MTDEKIGSTFSAEVRDLASDGRGIVSHPSGKTVFVSGVWPGEKGTFKITGKKGRVAFARMEKLKQASVHRMDPPCQYHGMGKNDCGGCCWMWVDYDAQLAAKQKRVEAGFSRLGVDSSIKPILASPKRLGYRNRAQFKTDGTKVGFVASQSNNIVPIAQCLVLNEHNNRTLTALSKSLPQRSWKPAKKHQWTTLDIDDTVNEHTVSVNKRLPFMQANHCQNQAMRRWLVQHMDPLDRDAKVIELFCGSGNFTALIAELGFQNIVAVEAVAEAVQVLKDKALQGVNVDIADLFNDDIFEAWIHKHRDARTLVLDPPREGLKVSKGLFHKKSAIDTILYISCDLATLLRDVKLFLEQGYKVLEVQPLDQFPHTAHIETCVVLKKGKRRP